MPAKVRIELVHDGFRELFQQPGVVGACEAAAQKIANAAGEGFDVTASKALGYGGGRVGCGVKTATYEARVAEAVDKKLSQAVSACRI